MEFFQTVMGHRFYESTMPELVKQLTRLNNNLEKMANREEEKTAAKLAFIEEAAKDLWGGEEELAGHDMDRCVKHHMPIKLCPDCGGLPEDPDELSEDRCEHGMFYSGAGACPKCGGGAE